MTPGTFRAILWDMWNNSDGPARRRAVRTGILCLLSGCGHPGAGEATPDLGDAGRAVPPDAEVAPDVAPPVLLDMAPVPLDALAPRPDAPLGPDAAPPSPDAAPPSLDASVPPLGLSPALVATLSSMRRPSAPLPDPTNRYADDAAAARLGHRLFFDVNLSRNGLNSCSGCHWPDRYFSGILTYDGHGGLDFRNVPSLVDASQSEWFFWDGRADSLWSQVRTPIESPHELDFDRVRLAHFVHELPLLRADYEAAFGPLPDAAFWARLPARAKPSQEIYEALLDTAWANMEEADRQQVNQLLANVGKALAAYERLLVTAPAPFDEFTDGVESRDPEKLAALDPAALRGLQLFTEVLGCVRCHSGPMFSDGSFHNLGYARLPDGPLDEGRAAGIPKVLADTFNAAGPYSDDPTGPRAQRLVALDVEDDDRGAFRTATLRNVAETPPYLHDGRFRTLEEVIRYKTSLPDVPAVGATDPALVPYNVSDEEVADLVAFLRSLTAPPVAEALRLPLP